MTCGHNWVPQIRWLFLENQVRADNWLFGISWSPLLLILKSNKVSNDLKVVLFHLCWSFFSYKCYSLLSYTAWGSVLWWQSMGAAHSVPFLVWLDVMAQYNHILWECSSKLFFLMRQLMTIFTGSSENTAKYKKCTNYHYIMVNIDVCVPWKPWT